MSRSIVYDNALRTRVSKALVSSHMQKRAATITDKRWTLAPLYEPDSVDAHGEYTTPAALEEAVNEFAKNGDRRLLLQHGDLGEHHVGTIMSAFTWPYEATIPMTDPATGKVTKHTFKPGTAFAWVEWDKDAWPLVLASKLKGYSMGGRALRRSTPGVELPNMGFDIRKSANALELLRTLAKTCEELRDRDPATLSDMEKQLLSESAPSPDGDGVLIVGEEGVYHVHRNGSVDLLREVEE